jgi:hypothetical protein
MNGRLTLTKANGGTLLVPAWELREVGITFVAWLSDRRPILVIDEESDPFSVPNTFSNLMALVLSEIGLVWLYRRDVE